MYIELKPERPPGWEEFARDNAVSLIEARDKKIRRLKRIVHRLELLAKQRLAEIRKMRGKAC